MNVIPDPEDLVKRLDALVEPAPEPENSVLTDNSRIVLWAGPMFALFAIVLVPWIIYIGLTLPARQLSPNYDLAWAGFDVMECAALACTAYFALRRSRYLSSAAMATATILVVDAWFDCMTTPANERLESILLCVLIELPLAAACMWISNHSLQFNERRITLLQMRQKRSAGGRREQRRDHGGGRRAA